MPVVDLSKLRNAGSSARKLRKAVMTLMHPNSVLRKSTDASDSRNRVRATVVKTPLSVHVTYGIEGVSTRELHIGVVRDVAHGCEYIVISDTVRTRLCELPAILRRHTGDIPMHALFRGAHDALHGFDTDWPVAVGEGLVWHEPHVQDEKLSSLESKIALAGGSARGDGFVVKETAPGVLTVASDDGAFQVYKSGDKLICS